MCDLSPDHEATGAGDIQAERCRALWCEVINHALADAVSEPSGNHRNSPDVRAAREWFRRGGRDFQTVCDLTGMDPEALRERVLPRLPDDGTLPKRRRDNSFVSRRAEVLALDDKGLSAHAIGRRLGVSHETVYRHLRAEGRLVRHRVRTSAVPEQERERIVSLRLAGVSARDIIAMTGRDRGTVYRILQAEKMRGVAIPDDRKGRKIERDEAGRIVRWAP